MGHQRATQTRTAEATRQKSTATAAKLPLLTGAPIHPILQLQRTIGNQAVERLLESGVIQAKLRIGQPGDMYEQEADRVADMVMRTPAPRVQRQIEPEEEDIQRKPLASTIAPLIQRQNEELEEEEEEKLLQAERVPGRTPAVTSDIQSRIQALPGGGQPLPATERTFFEPRFGYDFSRVRVHTDARAADSARAVNARAFTLGRNVVFGAGEYAPKTDAGRRLLAHELTHVVQQTTGQMAVDYPINGTIVIQRQLSDEQLAEADEETLEAELEKTSAKIDELEATGGLHSLEYSELVEYRSRLLDLLLLFRPTISTGAGKARERLAELSGRLLIVHLQTEQMRPLFKDDKNLKSQHDVLTEHIERVTGFLERAGQGLNVDTDLLRAAEVGLVLAGLAYDLMRADREGVRAGISRVVRPGANRGLAWTWKGMRALKADPAWPTRQPDDVREVLKYAEFHRDTVLELAKVTSVLKAGVTAATVVSGAAGLSRAFVGGISALGRVASWMKGLRIESGVLQLSTGGAVPVFRIVSTAGALELTAAEVVVLAEAGRVSATALNLYMMARGPAGAVTGAPTTKKIAGTRGLEHSFDRHAAEWFGRTVSKSTDLSKWQELIERAAKSKQVFEWSTGGTPTVAHLARIEGKWFVVQFFKSGPRAGELGTAFVPKQNQLTAMLRLLGK